jgi:hypothetical protein
MVHIDTVISILSKSLVPPGGLWMYYNIKSHICHRIEINKVIALKEQPESFVQDNREK